MKLYYQENQAVCYECGKTFVPDKIPTRENPVVACTCPDGCRGSWCSLEKTAEYCVPIDRTLFRVDTQYFTDRQGDRNRGLGEGSLGMAFSSQVFSSLKTAENYRKQIFPHGEKMRESFTVQQEF